VGGRELCKHRGFCKIPKEPYRGNSSRRVYVQLYQMILQGEVSHFSLVGRHLMEERRIFPVTLVLRGISKKDILRTLRHVTKGGSCTRTPVCASTQENNMHACRRWVPTATLAELAENSCMGAMRGDLDLDQPGQTEGEWEYWCSKCARRLLW